MAADFDPAHPPSFAMRRAQPIAGPGIDPDKQPRRQRRVGKDPTLAAPYGTDRGSGSTEKAGDPSDDSSIKQPHEMETTRNPAPLGNGAAAIPISDVLGLCSLPEGHTTRALTILKGFNELPPNVGRYVLVLVHQLWPELFEK